MEKQSGITIYQAANSVQSMINKRLLYRHSDLIASGDLDLVIPAMGYSAPLPSDFVALAEKPNSQDLYTDWMAGTVFSYNSTTGALVVNVNQSAGTDTLASWDIATVAVPGSYAQVIGSSTTSLTVGNVTQTLVATAGMSLSAGAYILIVPTDMPLDTTDYRVRKLRPRYLNDDEHDEYSWWEWYGLWGDTSELPCPRPNSYKIIGTTFYIRPKVIVSVKITGRYFAALSHFAFPTDIIPWNGFFDEVFREGVVRIILKGVSVPEADKDMAVLVNREVDTLLDARISLIPNTRRVKRGDYL
jgi:hypothetical protein